MYDTISVEDMNTPAVVLTNQGFILDGASAASGKGMPLVRMVPEPVPCECSVAEEAEAGIDQVMDALVEALTKPLTEEERSPKAKEPEKAEKMIFKGNLEEVNRFFYGRGWGDGLPVIPPTEEAVRDMLAGTDLPPDHVVGKLVPRLGKATVEKIAINAVMAGALPTYMPVLLACIDALLDPGAMLGTYNVSTGSWAPFWIFNGPIRQDLHINSGSGALSPGDIANATIGRAMGLIIKNIGGVRKGVEDMGVLGNPSKYAMVIAENEEASPWEPLHVERGFEKEENTVTLFFPNSYSQIWPFGTDDRGILNALLYNLQPSRRGLTCFLLNPSNARTLAKNGWTKEGIKNYVCEFGRVPAYRHPFFHGVYATLTKKDAVPLNPMDPVAILPGPEVIQILVAGGPGAFMGLISSSVLGDTNWVTKKIELPSHWAELVDKYKNVVPTYARY